MTDMEHFEGSRTSDPVVAPAATEEDVVGFGGNGGVRWGDIRQNVAGGSGGVFNLLQAGLVSPAIVVTPPGSRPGQIP